MSTISSHVSEKKSGGLFHRKSKNEGNQAGDGGVIGRRKAIKTLEEQGRKGTWGDDMGLNAMGRLYTKVVNFSPITRYLVYVAPVALLLAVPLIVLGVTGNINTVHVGNATGANAPRLFYLFLWIEVSWLSLWGGKIVAILLPSVFMFFCGVVSTGTRKYATVIRNLEVPISLLLWALASWLLFKYKFTDDSYQWVYVIVRILGSLWVSSCVLLGEKFIIQLISISYHQRSFANRIRESKREIYLLGLMYDASRTLFPMYCEEFAEEDYVISDSIEAMLVGNKKRRRGHKKSGSATPINPMNLVGGVGRFGDKITSVFGNIASEITGKQMFNPNSAHSVVIEALEKVRSSEALARRIWMSFVVEGKDALYQEDVTEVLGPGHRDEAEECFEAVDADENGDISLDEMVRKVVEVGKERKAINNSMKDIGQALGVLDSILLFIVLMIVVIIFLSFFQSSFVSTLSSAGTALISLSFAISTTCQEFLGSIIFLFVKHPYDVGDRVDINGERLIVEKISLLYTIFTDLKEMQVTQTPNIILNNLWIDNLSRSKAMKESIEVNISYDTSFEDVELLRLEMEKFVRHSDNSRDFQPDLVIGVGSVGDCDKLTLNLSIKHKSNWHNEAVRATRRSKFMCALALALRKVPINGPGGGGSALGSSDNPAYSVAVDDEFAKDARTKAADAADAARLVPHKPTKASAKRPTDAASMTGGGDRPQHVTEQQAIAELTARPVLQGLDSEYGYNRDRSLDRGMSAHGSPTLHSRNDSAERTENIEQIRKSLQEDLISRHSTRGRRKAGDAVP
ncbi:Mechanosensitive ion channel-domain-containing protein, partial [Coniella lustricola]